MPYVLLTRSEQENLRLAEILKEHGISSISSPQVILQERADDFNISQYNSIIITSKYAAQIVSRKLKNHVSAYVVGEESAKILGKSPFIKVEHIYQNVSELAYSLINNDCKENIRPISKLAIGKEFLGDLERRNGVYLPVHEDSGTKSTIKSPSVVEFRKRSIVYLSGSHITKALPVDRFVIYDNIYTNEISANIIELIKAQQIKAVLVYSKKSALSLKSALICNNLASYIANIHFITLSKKIGLEFIDLGCKILYCNKPSEHEMITLLKKALYG
jgi:uroporphyrinogen-III synthase